MVVYGIPFSIQADKISMLLRDWRLEKEIAKSNQAFVNMTNADTYKYETSRIRFYELKANSILFTNSNTILFFSVPY
ncbi:hypothetical protein GvMRE_IIg472 [endosymbiont GvMRE of Glomus versiforme]|nr:hypothetical protein GvMRE_IIg472 [endosymbiont GvMRE of Glomus versiforme]